MNAADPLLVFTVDGQRIGLRLAVVRRVIRVAAIAPLPKAPAVVLGVINVEGRIVPVVDVRGRFRFPPREIALSDHLILARTAAREVALLVDAAEGVVEPDPAAIVRGDAILPRLDYVEGVAKLPDGLIFIHDLDTFLSLEEGAALDAAVAPAGSAS